MIRLRRCNAMDYSTDDIVWKAKAQERKSKNNISSLQVTTMRVNGYREKIREKDVGEVTMRSLQSEKEGERRIVLKELWRWTHFPAVSGAFMDSPYNGNTSLQTSTSNLNASYSRPSETEDDGKVSSDTIWLWIAVLATIGNIVVVAVVCACAF
ncbi:uncharacterized protein C14orf132 [Scomber scombrus]|uniref:Uncharacterized protein C14orf132 n=1 Tax=Scomber scombrus TaxID=13677 RepID=A0AAV1PIQ2_SCOSC